MADCTICPRDQFGVVTQYLTSCTNSLHNVPPPATYPPPSTHNPLCICQYNSNGTLVPSTSCVLHGAPRLVTYVDPHGSEHSALVTRIHPPRDGHQKPCLNLVVVSTNPLETDEHGALVKRELAVVHESCQSAGGHYWK